MLETIDHIRESFEKSPFYQYLGLDLIDFTENHVKLKLTLQDHFLNANGTLHGGVHATMLDFVQGMLLRSVTKTKCVTTTLTTHYYTPITNGVIYAEAKILQLGYKTAFLEGEIKDAEDHLLAKGLGSFKLIREG